MSDEAKAEEKKLTPAQLAEAEESKRPWIEKLGDLVNEAASRCEHGLSPTSTFVNALRALHETAKAKRYGVNHG